MPYVQTELIRNDFKELKKLSVKTGKTVKAIVEEAILDYLEKHENTDGEE